MPRACTAVAWFGCAVVWLFLACMTLALAQDRPAQDAAAGESREIQDGYMFSCSRRRRLDGFWTDLSVSGSFNCFSIHAGDL